MNIVEPKKREIVDDVTAWMKSFKAAAAGVVKHDKGHRDVVCDFLSQEIIFNHRVKFSDDFF